MGVTSKTVTELFKTLILNLIFLKFHVCLRHRPIYTVWQKTTSVLFCIRVTDVINITGILCSHAAESEDDGAVDYQKA